MDKAKQILEEALSYKNCDGLIEENRDLLDTQHLWSRHYDIENKLNYWICLNCGDKSKTYSNPVTCGKNDA